MEDRKSNVYIVRVDESESKEEPIITPELIKECKKIADKYPLKKSQFDWRDYMKCSVLKTLDYNNLNKNIAYYREEYGRDPYLFMSDTTANAIMEDTKRTVYVTKPFEPTGGYVGRFEGYRIYKNEDLEFGEVELR